MSENALSSKRAEAAGPAGVFEFPFISAAETSRRHAALTTSVSTNTRKPPQAVAVLRFAEKCWFMTTCEECHKMQGRSICTPTCGPDAICIKRGTLPTSCSSNLAPTNCGRSVAQNHSTNSNTPAIMARMEAAPMTANMSQRLPPREAPGNTEMADSPGSGSSGAAGIVFKSPRSSAPPKNDSTALSRTYSATIRCGKLATIDASSSSCGRQAHSL